METAASPTLVHDRLNAVRQYVVYGPREMPPVEVFSYMGSEDVDASWAAGELRMHTVHEDGSRTFTVQFRLDGRLLVDNFPHERVRRPHQPPTPHVEPTMSMRRRFTFRMTRSTVDVDAGGA